MKTKHLLLNFLLGSAAALSAQTVLNVKIASALDDHEERTIGNVTQSGTAGNMYPGSTALDLGNYNSTSDPMLIGLRFTGINIPKFTTITSAYIQFTVKGTSKNDDPCALKIYAENNVNPAAFTDNALSISSRAKASGFITWNVSSMSNWNTVGAAGTDQQTPNLKTLVQPLLFNNNWVSGNAMVFIIDGSGSREVEAYEGDPAKAAQLIITYGTGTGTTTTGVAELERISSVSVYPNPFKGQFNVNVQVDSPSDVIISTYDLTGKLVEEKIAKQVPAGSFHYTSTTLLVKGMYFIKVQANNKQEVLKLIAE